MNSNVFRLLRNHRQELNTKLTRKIVIKFVSWYVGWVPHFSNFTSELQVTDFVSLLLVCVQGTLQLKCDGTRWRTGGGSEGGNWRMQWVASTLHTTSEHGVSSITTADAHTSAVPAVDWTDAPPPPADLNGLVLFARRTKSGFCSCAITFQLALPRYNHLHQLCVFYTQLNVN